MWWAYAVGGVPFRETGLALTVLDQDEGEDHIEVRSRLYITM